MRVVPGFDGFKSRCVILFFYFLQMEAGVTSGTPSAMENRFIKLSSLTEESFSSCPCKVQTENKFCQILRIHDFIMLY